MKQIIKLVGFTLIMICAAYLAYHNMSHQLKELRHELMLQHRRYKIDSIRIHELNNMDNSIEPHDTIQFNYINSIEPLENNELNKLEQ